MFWSEKKKKKKDKKLRYEFLFTINRPGYKVCGDNTTSMQGLERVQM